ncbi:MAG TPA: sulfite exporter TauE/SafE family protein [Ktedonobacteraceae bacterium]|nr:sulfite exporter TauE/SafE family protein [Ktedonobacteraceae bacterium]
MDYRFSLVGLLIGFLVGLTGMGGGSLLAPIMILVFRIPPVWAVSTDIAYSTVTKAVGSIVHIRQKQVDFSVALWLACGSVPATLLSVGLVQLIRKHYGNLINGVILHALGFTLILVAVLLVLKPFLMRRIEQRRLEREKQAALAQGDSQAVTAGPNLWEKRYRPIVTILVGAFVGFLVGLTSVGSGTLIIVSIAFLFPRLTPKQLVGTDVFQAFMLLAAGAIGYLSSGTINWGIAGMLLIGSLPGVLIGSRASKYIPDRYMRPVLATVLVISGVKLI